MYRKPPAELWVRICNKCCDTFAVSEDKRELISPCPFCTDHKISNFPYNVRYIPGGKSLSPESQRDFMRRVGWLVNMAKRGVKTLKRTDPKRSTEELNTELRVIEVLEGALQALLKRSQGD
jgi:hypothetical protein